MLMMRRDGRGFRGRDFLLALGACDRPNWTTRRAILLQHEMDAQLCALYVGARNSRSDDLAGASGTWHDVTRIDTHRWASVAAEIAETGKYPFVLVGYAMRKTVRDRLLGTEVERLLRDSSRPVLVAKAEPVKTYRKVLVATHLGPSSFAAALVASRLFPGALLELVSSIHAPFEGFLDRETMLPPLRTERMTVLRRTAISLAQTAKRQVSAEVIEGDFPFAIAEKARAELVDLLVVGCRSGGTIRGWRRRRALDLVAASPVDVLVVPDPPPPGATERIFLNAA